MNIDGWNGIISVSFTGDAEIMLEKIIRFFNEHPIKFFACTFLGLLVIPTTVIHIIYIVPTGSWWSQETIPAGSMLSYIGTVLTFCATFMLSITVYLSNKEQSERMQIAENKAILIVNESYDVVVGLSNPKNIERDDFFIKMKFKILSNAPINEMKIIGLSIKGMSYPGSENKKIIQDYESERNVNFQYEDKGNVIINFDIKDEQLQNMFKEFNCIELRIDMEVLCNNVETKVVVDTLFDVDEHIGCKDGITCKECKIRNSNTFCNNAYLC